jgi:hypothetical protein
VGEPEPLPTPRLPSSFDGDAAVAFAIDFATTFPTRTPGTPEAGEAADWVQEQLETYGFRVERRSFTEEIPGLGRRELVNLVAFQSSVPATAARSSDTIVVVAHRDNLGASPGADDNASGTGVLIQLARELGTTALGHTLVFVSTDGGAAGALGARDLARQGARTPSSPFSPERALAVLALDALGGQSPPRLLLAGDSSRLAAASLVASVSEAVRRETGARPTHAGAATQLVDLAVPITTTDQGPLLAGGLSAVTLTTAAGRRTAPEPDVVDRVDRERIKQLGRAAQSVVSALDGAAEVARGTSAYVFSGGRTVRGWAIALTLLAGLLPAIGAVVELLARCRKQRVRLAPALRSLRSRVLIALWGAGLVGLLTAFGLLPRAPGRALAPDLAAAQEWAVAPVAVIGGLVLLGRGLAHPRLRRRGPVEPEDELAGHAAALLALCVIALAVALVNPFALVFVLPSLHAWLWLPNVVAGSVASLVLWLLGLAGPAFLVASVALRLGTGLDTPWYLLTLVTTGAIPVALVVLTAAWLGVALMTAALAFGRYAPYPRASERPLGPARTAARWLVRRRRSRLAARPPGAAPSMVDR